MKETTYSYHYLQNFTLSPENVVIKVLEKKKK